MIKAIIFDFGGVYFTYSHDLLLNALKRTLNLNKKTIKKAWLSYIYDYNEGKVSENVFWKKFKNRLKINSNDEVLRKSVLSIFKPIKDTHKIVQKLGKKYQLCLLSNHTNWLDDLNRKFDFYKNFDVIINSFKVGARKPNTKIFKTALKKLGVKPKECVFIDDTIKYVKKAKKLGIKGIVFKSTEQLKQDLKKLGVKWSH